MISALIPSRGRPELLARSVRSLRDRASEPPEILVAADDDDPATAEAARELGAVTLVTSRAGYDRLHEYYQGMAAVATGDWLLTWNDDAQMMTPGWDAIIAELPPRILVADVRSTHSPLCCVPAIRREAVTALGRFSTNNPHVDTFWGDIALAAGVLMPVPVFATLDTPAGCNPHGFYEPAHQGEMAACAQLLRDYVKGLA